MYCSLYLILSISYNTYMIHDMMIHTLLNIFYNLKKKIKFESFFLKDLLY